MTPAAGSVTAVKGRRGELAGHRQRRPDARSHRVTPNLMASRSVCRFRQNEGDTGAVVVALAQPVRRIDAVEAARNKATACGRGGA